MLFKFFFLVVGLLEQYWNRDFGYRGVLKYAQVPVVFLIVEFIRATQFPESQSRRTSIM